MVSSKEQEQKMELLVQEINRRIEDLIVQFNLFFTGEIRIPPERERGDLEKRIRNRRNPERWMALYRGYGIP